MDVSQSIELDYTIFIPLFLNLQLPNHESHPAYVVMFISVLLTAECGCSTVGFTVDIMHRLMVGIPDLDEDQ